MHHISITLGVAALAATAGLLLKTDHKVLAVAAGILGGVSLGISPALCCAESWGKGLTGL